MNGGVCACVDAGCSPSPEASADASLQEKVAALRSSQAYAERPRSIDAIETHFAWVFLADEFAFKLKKPMRVEFLQLATLAERRFNCSEEIRLNRRLAPDVYLDVVPLKRGAGGSLHVGGEGVVVDWLVKMRRLPVTGMLDTAIASGTVSCAALTDVGRMLARFYQAQQRIAFAPSDYLARIGCQVQADRSALLAPDLNIAPSIIESAAAAQLAAHAALERELLLRAQQGRIVEAHGDLRPEHICLSDPPCVIDSLEFSKDLRTLDPGEELAFLWVECARLGSAWVGRAILDSYLSESGDPIMPELLDFYRSRRAAVRAKLIAWHLRDPAVSRLADWSKQAREYLELARSYALAAVDRAG